MTKGKLQSTTTRLKTATEESVHTYSELNVTITLGTKFLRYCVLLADMTDDVILRVDVLTKFGLSLDLGAGCLRVGGWNIYQEIISQESYNP